MDRLLVLVRHGQSDWNLKNLFTGWKDPDLTPKGIEEAREGGRKLKALGLKFDCAFTSALVRAQNTLKLLWRRSYDVSPPGGESLKDTVARTLPYYCQEILPRVLRGERVLVSAHGNSLRALVMVLDRLTPKTIPSMELATGVPLVYRLRADSTVESKEVLA